MGEHTANDLNDRPVFSSIVRMSPMGEEVEIFADGVRNSMGMAFHPVTGDLWFTDNGPSWPFEHPETYDIPADELNRATQPGQHFGFPYIHASLPDPLIGNIAPEGIVGPAHEFQAHTAPLGIKFYTGTMFPEEYRNQAFIAEHGTEATTPVFGVRSRVHGDRITLARFDEAGDFVSYETFATGFMRDLNSNYNRRPVDLAVMPDGALLVSDDQAQTIYRISHTGN